MGMRPKNNGPVISVENKMFLSVKKSLPSEVECQDNVDLFFDIEAIVHHDCVPHGQTVNQVFYKDILKCLRENLQKTPKKMANWNLISSP